MSQTATEQAGGELACSVSSGLELPPPPIVELVRSPA